MKKIVLEWPADEKAIRHRVSHATFVKDILELLWCEKISIAKAEESILMRIAGNEPELPAIPEEWK